MYNLIRADLFKPCKSMGIKILLALTTLCAIAMMVIAYLIAQGKLDNSTSGIGFLFTDINIISLVGGISAAVFICGDFDNKTIHDAISCGCSRGTVIISKAIVFFCSIGLLLLPYAIGTGIGITMGNQATFNMGEVALGYMNMLMNEAGTPISVTMILKLLFVILILMLVYMSQLSICVPLAIIFKKPFLVVAVYYVISVISGQLLSLGNTYPAFGNIFSYTPFGGENTLVMLSTGAGELGKTILVSFAFMAVMLGLTYSVFRKTELK